MIVLQHSVVLKNLKPGVLYQYRVGGGETWSEWEHFTQPGNGPKFYPVNEKHKYLMKKLGTGLQLYQVIWVDGDVLRYESRTVTDELYDSFELRKPAARASY